MGEIMKMKNIMLMLTLTAALMTGCSQGAKSGEMKTDSSLIYVTSERKVSSSLVYTSEKENANYNQDELKSDVEAAVAEYNAAKGAAGSAQNTEGADALPVSLRSCTIDGKIGKLVFDYGSAGDFVEFAAATNDDTHTVTRLEVDSVAQAQANGIMTDAAMMKPDGAAVSLSDIAGQSDLSVIVTDGAGTVQTQGAIMYISTDADILDEYTARLSEGTHYIIFK